MCPAGVRGELVLSENTKVYLVVNQEGSGCSEIGVMKTVGLTSYSPWFYLVLNKLGLGFTWSYLYGKVTIALQKKYRFSPWLKLG